MREPDRFHHAVHSDLGRTKTFLHYVIDAPWTIPVWRALDLQKIFHKKEGEFQFEPLVSVMEKAMADPRVDLYGPVSNWRALYGGPQEPVAQISQHDLGETKRCLLDSDPRELPQNLQAPHAYLRSRLVTTASTMQNALSLAFELRRSISKTRLKENEFTRVPIAALEHRRSVHFSSEPPTAAQPTPSQTAFDLFNKPAVIDLQ